MKFHGLNDPQRPPVHYKALPGSSAEAGDAVEGDLLRGAHGYLFRDAQGQQWWVMFAVPRQRQGREAGSPSRQGQILACANVEDDEAEEVVVLAEGVSKEAAEDGFRRQQPGSFEEAARVAASLGDTD